VTEAGFGADLGAEKFLDIKARAAGIWPSATVVVATVRALKYHGGVDRTALEDENIEAMRAGLPNLRRHLENLRSVFGVPAVVSINRFPSDTDAEIAALIDDLAAEGVTAVEARHWAEGGAGAVELARAVMAAAQHPEEAAPLYGYELDASLAEKIEAVATRIYRAGEVRFPPAVKRKLDQFAEEGYAQLPVCIAKTQYSFSTDGALRGAPEGHVLEVRDVRLSAGAGFVVAVCGDIMTMPGLPKKPAALTIDVDDEGRITGLF